MYQIKQPSQWPNTSNYGPVISPQARIISASECLAQEIKREGKVLVGEVHGEVNLTKRKAPSDLRRRLGFGNLKVQCVIKYFPTPSCTRQHNDQANRLRNESHTQSTKQSQKLESYQTTPTT